MSDEAAESNPVILCLDTAYGGLSVGLLAADGQTYDSFEDTQYDQASHIVTAIDELLSTASTDKADDWARKLYWRTFSFKRCENLGVSAEYPCFTR